jgi:hypothetical protein
MKSEIIFSKGIQMFMEYDSISMDNKITILTAKPKKETLHR